MKSPEMYSLSTFLVFNIILVTIVTLYIRSLNIHLSFSLLGNTSDGIWISFFFAGNLFFQSRNFRFFSSYLGALKFHSCMSRGVCVSVYHVSGLMLVRAFQFNDSHWFSVLDIVQIWFCYIYPLFILFFNIFHVYWGIIDKTIYLKCKMDNLTNVYFRK